MKNLLLAQIYRLALLARDAWLFVRRPQTVGVRVLVVRQRHGDPEVLLVRHRAGRDPWELPGGAVDRREPVVDAARREVLEEAGLHVRVEALHGVFDNFRHFYSNTILVFQATPLGEPTPPNSLEIAEARFFRLDTLPNGLGSGSRQRIAEWQRGQAGALGDWWHEEIP